MFFTSPSKIKTKRARVPDARFSITHRQELISGFRQDKLANARGILIGAGGIGSEIAEGLCRKGVGHLVIFDHDRVEQTNLNRQHFFIRDVGKNKARRLARNLAAHCHAGTILESFPLSFQDALALGMDLKGAFAVCGVDNAKTRVAVSQYYYRAGCPVVFINVDLLAESGHVFVQESAPQTPCFGCAFPRAQAGRKAPCFVPSSKDILKVTAGLALYAIDGVVGMDRKRNWNYRRIHLASYAPDVIERIERNPRCSLCSQQEGEPSTETEQQQQGSPARATEARGALPGSSP